MSASSRITIPGTFTVTLGVMLVIALLILGRKSPNSLYDLSLATYEEGDKFDRTMAEGFIKLWGLPFRGHMK